MGYKFVGPADAVERGEYLGVGEGFGDEAAEAAGENAVFHRYDKLGAFGGFQEGFCIQGFDIAGVYYADV